VGSGRWLKSFLEPVGLDLSGFQLKRSRGDPIRAPGRFTVTTLFFLLSMMMMMMMMINDQ
jgi:hypothetical protein